MSFAFDANILLYASDTRSPYHQRARSFIESCISHDRDFLKFPFLDVQDPLAGDRTKT